jgi:rare lipoprotein A
MMRFTLCVLASLILVNCGSSGHKPTLRDGQVGYKIGTPYKIKGIRYYPKYERYYDEAGIASWYGPGFHNKATANGERYDKYEMTAAHRTLPMPSIVRVTNLENGRSIVVRVNDRGPFHDNRIIDLSKAAAQKINMIGKGTARVRVEYLSDETRQFMVQRGKEYWGKGQSYTKRTAPKKKASLHKALPKPQLSSITPPIQASPSQFYYIQAGAFAIRGNAEKQATMLRQFSPSFVQATKVNQKEWYRVLLGPMTSQYDADHILAQLSSLGYKDATLIRD